MRFYRRCLGQAFGVCGAQADPCRMSDTIKCELECRGLVFQPHRGTSATGLELNATLCLAMYLAALLTHIFFVHGIDSTTMYHQNTALHTIRSTAGNNYNYYSGDYNIKSYDYLCEYAEQAIVL